MTTFLDFYDDATGHVLKRHFATSEDVPGFIKTAHVLSEDERAALRDEAYALVMLNEGKIKRAFPVVDAGNTALSTLYFLAHRDRLPEEAQKTAAANLVDACAAYGLPVPPLLKVAAKKDEKPRNGMSRKRDPMDQEQYTGTDAEWNSRTNMQSVQGSQSAGGLAGPDGSTLKTASSRVVDVTGQKPTLMVKKASAQRYALEGRYPIDSFSDVEKAVVYFDENHNEFEPRDRHEYCVKVASRADELGVEVSELIRRYGSVEYAPDIDAHLISRASLTKTAAARELYEGMMKVRDDIEPEEFAILLESADRVSGLNWYYGGSVADPYFSTFGGWAEKEKVAFYRWMSPTNEYVTGEQLEKFARNNWERLEKHFDFDTANAFKKDPITIFESMPLPQKVILARLASDTQDASVN